VVIIVNPLSVVNPHRPPPPTRLAQVHDRILADLVILRRAGEVSRERMAAAGVPSLPTLFAEQQRRESAKREAA
jgi:hypothetical protein